MIIRLLFVILVKFYIFVQMKRLFTLKKFLFALGFLISLQSFAAFIGSTSGDDNSIKKISLKNFNRNNYKSRAYPSFRLSQFQYKGSQNVYQVNSIHSMEGKSMISFQNGNTTYVYPYSYKVKVPLFKTPASPNRSNH